MMPGDGAVMNGSTNPPRAVVERGAEIVAFGLDQRAIEVAHLADRLGTPPQVADRLARPRHAPSSMP